MARTRDGDASSEARITFPSVVENNVLSIDIRGVYILGISCLRRDERSRKSQVTKREFCFVGGFAFLPGKESTGEVDMNGWGFFLS